MSGDHTSARRLYEDSIELNRRLREERMGLSPRPGG
jgi:hypothetical protein